MPLEILSHCPFSNDMGPHRVIRCIEMGLNCSRCSELRVYSMGYTSIGRIPRTPKQEAFACMRRQETKAAIERNRRAHGWIP